MAPPETDPRVVGATNLGLARSVLQGAGWRALLDALGPAENIAHFSVIKQSGAAVLAAGGSRLLLARPTPLTPPVSYIRPVRVRVAKKGLILSEVELTDRDGRTTTLTMPSHEVQRVSADSQPDIRRPAPTPPPSSTAPPVDPGRDLGRAETWQQAESLAAEHMRRLGFVDARTTSSGRDGGIDVVARNAAAQVKYHATSSGAPDVQKLRGAAYGVEHVLFYATGYSPDALAFAESAGVALFKFLPLGGVEPVNQSAHVLVGMLRQAGPSVSAPPVLSKLEKWTANLEADVAAQTAYKAATHEERVANAASWAKHLATEANSPVDGWNKSGKLKERQKAVSLLSEASAYLSQAISPIKSDRDRKKALQRAETRVIQAGVHLHIKVKLHQRLG